MKSFKVFLVLMAAVLFSLSASVVFAAGEGARIKAWLMDMTFANGEGRGDVFDDEDDEAADSDKKIDFVAVAYMSSGFRGLAWQISAPGEYDLWDGFDLPNDSIRSIAVCPGYRVTLYEHSKFGGESVEAEESVDDLGEHNRWASSLKVEQIGEPDTDLAFEWYTAQSENDGFLSDLEDIDLGTAAAAKALEVHAERIERFKGAHEMSWYGTTTDAERVELGGELLKIFGDIGVDVNEWEAGDFAQAMNNFYDWNKDLSVWDTACVVLGVDPEAFER